MSRILQRIQRDVGIPNLAELMVERIEPTDLQSLLMEVYKGIVKNRNPRVLLSDYISNRLTHPYLRDPTVLLEWDRVAFSHLPKGFQAVELSPLCPLGTVSRVAPISQDWVLTTIRNSEVVADPTNVLALECAVRRRNLTSSNPTDATPVHLACSHRVVRAQRYQNPSALNHFRLFSLSSAGRDTGNLRFETAATAEHVRFYLNSIRHFLEPGPYLKVTITDLSQDSRYTNLLTPLAEDLAREFADVEIRCEKSPTRKTEYYQRLRFHVYASARRGREIELVDGGDTDWTQKLLNNAKERLLISGIGSERLCEEFSAAREPSRRRDV